MIVCTYKISLEIIDILSKMPVFTGVSADQPAVYDDEKCIMMDLNACICFIFLYH